MSFLDEYNNGNTSEYNSLVAGPLTASRAEAPKYESVDIDNLDIAKEFSGQKKAVAPEVPLGVKVGGYEPVDIDNMDIGGYFGKTAPVEKPLEAGNRLITPTTTSEAPAPESKPGFFGGVRDVGNAIAAGTLDLGQMVARSARAFDPPGGTDIVRDITTPIIDTTEKLASENFGPSKEAAEGGIASPRRALYEGVRSAIPSYGGGLPGAAIAGAVASPTVVGAVPSAIAGFAAGAGGLFAASEYDRFIEEGMKAGKTYEELMPYALASGAFEGGGEGLADVIGARFLGIGKEPFKATVKAMLTKPLLEIAKGMAKQLPVEVGTEIGQEAGEAWLRNKAGVSDASPLDNALSVIGPTIVMTLLMGTGGSAYDSYRRKGIEKALTDPTTDGKTRMDAVQKIASGIAGDEKEKDYAQKKELAKGWFDAAKPYVERGDAIPIDEDTSDFVSQYLESAKAEAKPKADTQITDMVAKELGIEPVRKPDLLSTVTSALNETQPVENDVPSFEAQPDAQRSQEQSEPARPFTAPELDQSTPEGEAIYFAAAEKQLVGINQRLAEIDAEEQAGVNYRAPFASAEEKNRLILDRSKLQEQIVGRNLQQGAKTGANQLLAPTTPWDDAAKEPYKDFVSRNSDFLIGLKDAAQQELLDGKNTGRAQGEDANGVITGSLPSRRTWLKNSVFMDVAKDGTSSINPVRLIERALAGKENKNDSIHLRDLVEMYENALSNMQEQSGGGKLPSTTGASRENVIASDLIPGSKFSINGENFTVKPSEIPGKVVVKDGKTVEVDAATRITFDKNSLDLNAPPNFKAPVASLDMDGVKEDLKWYQKNIDLMPEDQQQGHIDRMNQLLSHGSELHSQQAVQKPSQSDITEATVSPAVQKLIAQRDAIEANLDDVVSGEKPVRPNRFEYVKKDLEGAIAKINRQIAGQIKAIASQTIPLAKKQVSEDIPALIESMRKKYPVDYIPANPQASGTVQSDADKITTANIGKLANTMKRNEILPDEKQVNIEPTVGQKDAGNYQKEAAKSELEKLNPSEQSDVQKSDLSANIGRTVTNTSTSKRLNGKSGAIEKTPNGSLRVRVKTGKDSYQFHNYDENTAQHWKLQGEKELTPVAIKDDGIVARIASAINERVKSAIFTEFGAKAVPGLRMQEHEEAGRWVYMVAKGEASQAEFDSKIDEWRKENRIEGGNRVQTGIDFNPSNAIKIAADTIDQLRRTDVYRVLSENKKHIDEMQQYIYDRRPDLRDAVDAAMVSIQDEKKIAPVNDALSKDGGTAKKTDEGIGLKGELNGMKTPEKTGIDQKLAGMSDADLDKMFEEEKQKGPEKDARTASVGKITGARTRRLEDAGYTFSYGKMTDDEFTNVVGVISGKYADRLKVAGIKAVLAKNETKAEAKTGSFSDEVKTGNSGALIGNNQEPKTGLDSIEGNEKVMAGLDNLFGKKEEPAANPTEHLAKSGIEAVEGIGAVFKGLNALFGGNKMSMGVTFDEDTYAKAKPLFIEAWEHAKKAGYELKQFITELVEKYGEAIKPYARRFLGDVRDGKIEQQKDESKKGTDKTDKTPTPDDKTYVTAHEKIAESVTSHLKAGIKFTSADLFKWSDEAYTGSQAQGTYTVKDAYDAMELGVNKWIESEQINPDGGRRSIGSLSYAQKMVDDLTTAMSLLPTQTKRTTEQQEYQQFSTPPQLAFTVAWAADILPSDVVMEPSAGIGGIAVFAKIAQPKSVIVNEYSQRRAEVLRAMGFDKVYTENAEQLSNLPAIVNERPTVIVMNPPFSSTAGRLSKNDTMNGAVHIEEALKILEPGGRLVAIVGQGMAHDRPAFTKWWGKIGEKYSVVANIGISGQEYAKYGTTFDNQLLIIDKPKTGENPSENAIITGRAETVRDALPLLWEVRNARQAIDEADRRPEQPGAQPNQPQDAGGDESGSGSDTALLPPTDGLGNGGGQSKTNGRPGGYSPGGKSKTKTPRGNGTTDDKRLGGIDIPADNSGNEPAAGGGSASGSNGKPLDSDQLKVLTLEAPDVQPAEKIESDSIYEPYTPKKVKIAGAQPHPATLVESAAMAAIEPPSATYQPKIAQDIIDAGKISDAQMETIVYAGQAHGQTFPDGKRQGFMIGDGTGVGKGREIAGVLLDNYNHGRKKAIWISEKWDLMPYAKGDLNVIGWKGETLIDFKKMNGSEKEGTVFITYDTLRSVKKQTKEQAAAGAPAELVNLNKLVSWLGHDFDGVIAFDESHNMANGMAAGKGKSAAQKALAGIALQDALPNARILYVSATGATEVSNLAYADRLGLWGEGTQFPDINAFVAEITQGGVSAMEFVAQSLKSMGLYTARSISFKDVQYDRIEHKITDNQREDYNEMARAWQLVLADINAALDITKANKNQKSFIVQRFWSQQMSFYDQVLTSMQTPSVIKSIEEDMRAGRSSVLQLISTNEAATDRARAQLTEEDSLEDLDITPLRGLLQMVDAVYPINQYEKYTDKKGNIQSRQVFDSQGKPVINQEALGAKNELLAKLGSIKVPDGMLDQILWHFGTDAVAEVTGRNKRIVVDKNGTRTDETFSSVASKADVNAFMDGRKRILVFSKKGMTGRSFHADLEAKNQQQRHHYLLQAGWRADQAIQGLGRTHRSNQASAPIVSLVTTNLKAQKRFISTIAKRLDQLGAMTKGQRQTGSSGLFSASDNLESSHAHDALRQFFVNLVGEQYEYSQDEFETQSGLKLIDSRTGSLKDQLPPMRQVLNRMLSMTDDMQNKVFDDFATVLDQVVAWHKERGSIDVGLETITGESVRLVSQEDVYTDPRTGAVTKYAVLDVDNKTIKIPFEDSKGKSGPRYVVNIHSGQIWSITGTRQNTNATTGQITNQYVMRNVTAGVQTKTLTEIDRGANWRQIIDLDEAKQLWDQQYDEAKPIRTQKLNMVTGALLPVWRRLKGYPRIVRTQTDDGKQFLGRIIPESELNATLEALGASGRAKDYDLKEVHDYIMQHGLVAVLDNGWRIRRSTVSGDARLEVSGAEMRDRMQLKGYGVFDELINFKTRFFIPVGKVDILGKVVKYNAIVSVINPNALFGGTPLASRGVSLDRGEIAQDEKYIQAKPLLSEAWENAKTGGYDIKRFADEIIQWYGDGIKPYIRQFLKDQRDGSVNVEPQKPETKKEPAKKHSGNGSIKTPAKGGIEDAGQELLFNRRNKIRGGLKWDDIKDMNDALKAKQATKETIWPRPDYEQLIADGMPEALVHYYKQIYDSILSKPGAGTTATDDKIKRFVNTVNLTREGLDLWLADEGNLLKWMARYNLSPFDMKYTEEEQRSAKEPEEYIRNVASSHKWKIGQDYNPYNNTSRMYRDLVTGSYRGSRKAVTAVTEDGWPSKKERWQVMGYNVLPSSALTVREETYDASSGPDAKWEKRHSVQIDNDGRVSLLYGTDFKRDGQDVAVPRRTTNKKDVEDFIEPFKPFLAVNKNSQIIGEYNTEEEATNALRGKVRASARGEDEGISEKGIRVSAAVREGVPRRATGEDIDSVKLMETFGFKGVNFGNWMKDPGSRAEAQLHLNFAYDSLLDLAEMLNVPPKALSLNGMLGFAVGAQGKGGKNAWAAHFVPGVNEINLTREHGAGSLAHEFAHALDHYFAIMAGHGFRKEPYASDSFMENSGIAVENLRPEIRTAFQTISQTMASVKDTPEQIQVNRETAVRKAQDSLTNWLNHYREKLGDAALQSQWDEVVGRINIGEYGDGYMKLARSERQVFPVLKELEAIIGKSKTSAPADRLYNIHRWIDLVKSVTSRLGDDIGMAPDVQSNYMKAASELDKGKKRIYWSSPAEMFARAFDAFVSDDLQQAGIKNTYLSHVDKNDVTVPQGDERKAINSAFTTLIGELKTKEEDGKTVLYSLAKDKDITFAHVSPMQLRNALKPIQEALGKSGLTLEIMSSPSEMGAPRNANGMILGKRIVLFSENIGSVKDAQRVLLDEAYGHHGMRLMGKEGEVFLNELFALEKDNIAKYHAQTGREIDTKTVGGKQKAAEEYFAHEIRNNAEYQKQSYWQRFVAMVRRWLKSNEFTKGFVDGMSDNDIADMVRRSQQAAERRTVSPVSLPSFAEQRAYSAKARVADVRYSMAPLSQDLTRENGLAAEKPVFTDALKNFKDMYFLNVKNDDMTKFDRIVGTMWHLANKFPALRPFLNIEQNREEDRSEFNYAMLHSQANGERPHEIFSLNKQEREGLRKALIESDAKQYYETDNAKLAARGLSPKQIDAYHSFKTTMDLALKIKMEDVKSQVVDQYKNEPWAAALDDVIEERKTPMTAALDVEKKDQKAFLEAVADLEEDTKSLREYRSEMGSVKFYYPREHGRGDYMITVKDKDGRNVYLKRVENRIVGAQIRNSIIAKYPADQYTIEAKHAPMTSETIYQQINDVGLEKFVELALDKIKEGKGTTKEDARAMRKALMESLSDELKARGWDKHMIHRKDGAVVAGYEDEDVLRVFSGYITGLGGIISKRKAALAFIEQLKGMDLKTQQYEFAQQYVRDMLRNDTAIDRMSGKLRGLAFSWYLLGNLKSAAVQFTQNFVTGMPFLSRALKDGGVSGTGKAEKVYGKAMIDVATGKLTDEENAVLHAAIAKGVTTDQFIQEQFGKMEGQLGQAYQNALKVLSTPFSGMEIFNRKSALIAMYRTQKEINPGMKIGPQGYNDDAYRASHDFVYDTHFLYGKSNLPEWGRQAGVLGAGLRTSYTFRSFNHNYVLNMVRSAKGKDGKLALDVIGRSLAYLAMFAGFAGLPWLDDLLDIMERMTGNTYRLQMRKALRWAGGDLLEKVGMQGIPALIGVDVSGSMKMGIPLSGGPTNEVFGVFGGLYDKGGRAFKSALRGDYARAFESASPAFIENPMKAYREYSEGARNAFGSPVYDRTGRPTKLSPLEAIGQAAGFRPSEKAMQAGTQRSAKNIATSFTNRKGEIYDEMRIAGNNPGKRKSVLDDIAHYNEDAMDVSRRTGFTLPLIKSSGLRSALRERPKKGLILDDF